MRYVSVALLLLLMLPITWGVRTWRVSEVEEQVAAMQNEAVADALVEIERSFDALQDDLLAAAQRDEVGVGPRLQGPVLLDDAAGCHARPWRLREHE